MIKKLSNGTFRLVSKKLVNGKHRNLGTFRTKAEAVKHEGQVEYFKRQK
jgi:hypothetical protein